MKSGLLTFVILIWLLSVSAEARSRGGQSTSDTTKRFEAGVEAAAEATQPDTSTRDGELLNQGIPGECADIVCQLMQSEPVLGEGGGDGSSDCISIYDRKGVPLGLTSCETNPFSDIGPRQD